MAKIHESHSTLNATVEALDPSQWLESMEGDHWTIKDIIAHIAAWEEVLIRFHIHAEPFDQVVGVENADYWGDEINAHFYRRARDWPLEKVREFAADTYETLIQTLDELPEDKLREPPAHSHGESQSQSPLLDYVVGNTYDHYDEHLASIRAIVAQSKE